MNSGQDFIAVLEPLGPFDHLRVALFGAFLCRNRVGDGRNPVFSGKKWCALQDLNLRPLPCEGNALPLS